MSHYIKQSNGLIYVFLFFGILLIYLLSTGAQFFSTLIDSFIVYLIAKTLHQRYNGKQMWMIVVDTLTLPTIIDFIFKWIKIPSLSLTTFKIILAITGLLLTMTALLKAKQA